MSNPKHHLSPPSPSFSGLPLTPENVRLAHSLIKPYIHRTPLLTCQTLNNLASTPRHPGGASPKINLYFKCENYQKIGAFKARGAFHTVIRLIEKLGLEEVKKRGVVTHSSGTALPPSRASTEAC
jgi:threonine dehydratase